MSSSEEEKVKYSIESIKEFLSNFKDKDEYTLIVLEEILRIILNENE